MFGGGGNNPYDDIVAKTTDENLTSENWELILNLCDKVNDEGQEGAHSVIASILKRLAHRNPNVQLYALTLAEALSKNCGIELHREIASRAFTQGLEKLITDRTTHDKVKRRALSLIAQWTAEFEKDTTLGVMEDCYNNLKSKNYKFEAPQEAPPPAVDDEIRRKEEEELQRVLEMSMQDKGGRGHWQQYSLAASDTAGASSSGAGSSSSVNAAGPVSSSNPISTNTTSASKAYNQPLYQSGYVPARTPSPKVQTPIRQSSYNEPTPVTTSSATSSATTATNTPTASSANIVTRVRALHTFEPTEPGELAFEKGDIIKVVDRGYKDWWRGQLKGRTGIFPVNYVEPMPEPTAAELAKEAEQEAAVFAQAVNVEKLLLMLRSLDPAKDNLADNEEIQELYRSSMALRPKIVKLIDKYSQKRADLVSMNETFLRARSIFDRMMEESLARHTGVYDTPYRAPQYPRPDSRGHDYAPTPAPQAFGWNPAVYDQPGYNAFPAPAAAYGVVPAPDPNAYPPGPQLPQGQPQPGVQPGVAPYVDPSLYAQQAQVQPQPPAAGYPQPYPNHQQPYGPQGPSPYPAQQQPAMLPQQQPQQSSPQQQSFQQQPQTQTQQQVQQQPQQQVQQQPVHAPSLVHSQSYTAPQDTNVATQPQSQGQVQVLPQAQAQQVPTQAQPAQTADQPATQQHGPPYVFDPNATYADPNVQAWAQYYAKGGTDLAGAVYFISVPGLTDGQAPRLDPVAAAAQPAQQQAASAAQQTQPHQDTSPVRSSSIGSIPDPYAGTVPPGRIPETAGPTEQAGYASLHSQAQAQSQPANTFSTPSWVLPRHPSTTTSSSPPQSPGQTHPGPGNTALDHRNTLHDPHGQQYGGAPVQQFAGLSLTENGPVAKPQVGV